jgi:hypothetical protein
MSKYNEKADDYTFLCMLVLLVIFAVVAGILIATGCEF